MPSKRHEPEEIVTKVGQVYVMMEQRKTQREAIRAIGGNLSCPRFGGH